MTARIGRRAILAGLCASGMTAGRAASGQGQRQGLENDAFQAWLFALPLIEMAAARARLSQRAPNSQDIPNNVLVHAPGLAGVQSRSITTPNRDTLYSSAFVDLTRGPVTLGLPDSGARYLSVAVLDMYTNAAIVVGTRTTGGRAGTYRLIGPHEGPRDGHDLTLPTPHGWLLVRVLADGDDDLAAAQKVQKAVALSGPMTWSTGSSATRAAPWPQYFQSALRLLQSDPPTYKAGYDAFDRLRRAGSGGNFERAGYSAEQAQAIDRGVAGALQLVQSPPGRPVGGWSYPPSNLGLYGDDFALRAVIAVTGLGALPVAEAMYMRPAGDDGNGLFRGDGFYRLHLAKPVPARAFWSLTLYEATADGQFYFTPNALGRYAIGDRTRGLVRNADGSLDLWIGRSDPGDAHRANWLPAPARGPFSLTLRAYLPEPDLLEGRYRLPPVEQVRS